MDFVPSEKATTIRVPATANLQIDSADRNENINPSPFDFQITRDNSLLNGFFTRIGTTEVVLEWNEPNGAYISQLGATQMLISSPVYGLSTINIPSNNFSSNLFFTAEQAIDQFATTATGNSGVNFSTMVLAGQVILDAGGVPFALSTSKMTQALGIQASSSLPPAPSSQFSFIEAPDVRPYRYLDFISPQLTYNQDLKDSSSAPVVRDVLCRWYMDWDNQPQRDGLGFPIEMGYEPFKLRRLFNPPKQIRWDSRQPVGNLAFQVFGNGELAPIQPNPNVTKGSEWLLTAQVSEN